MQPIEFPEIWFAGRLEGGWSRSFAARSGVSHLFSCLSVILQSEMKSLQSWAGCELDSLRKETGSLFTSVCVSSEPQVTPPTRKSICVLILKCFELCVSPVPAI